MLLSARWFLALSLLTLLSACAGPSPREVRRVAVPGSDCCRPQSVDGKREAIVRTAMDLIGATTIESHGRRIAYDCAGVTRAVYLAHGIDLYDDGVADGKENGVRLIYNHLRAHGRLHRGPAVQAGDLVFFDNTWDYDGDGLANDPLTHIGIVERAEADGTVVFISRVAGAIERYRMNLSQPHVHRSADGRLLNDYMRRKRRLDQAQTAYLTGELFAGFGTRVIEYRQP